MCILHKKECNLHVPTFYVNNIAIEFVKQYKYLGINLSANTKDDIDVRDRLDRLLKLAQIGGNCYQHRMSFGAAPSTPLY